MSKIKSLTDENFETETSKGKVLLDFSAEWCGPCRMLGPVLEKIEADLGKMNTLVFKVDVDHAQKAAANFRIMRVPTMVLLKNGKEIGRVEGLRDEEEIKEFISKND